MGLIIMSPRIPQQDAIMIDGVDDQPQNVSTPASTATAGAGVENTCYVDVDKTQASDGDSNETRNPTTSRRRWSMWARWKPCSCGRRRWRSAKAEPSNFKDRDNEQSGGGAVTVPASSSITAPGTLLVDLPLDEEAQEEEHNDVGDGAQWWYSRWLLRYSGESPFVSCFCSSCISYHNCGRRNNGTVLSR